MSQLKIHIKLSDGAKSTYEISEDAKVLELKEKISKDLELGVERLRLIYAGKVLKDELSIKEYNIKDDQTLHLVKSNPPQKKEKQAETQSNTTASPSINNNTTDNNSTSNPNPLNFPFGNFNLGGNTNATGFGNIGLGNGTNPFGMDNEAMSSIQNSLLNNPEYMQQMTSLLSNPEMMRLMMQSSPELASLGMTPEQLSSMMSLMSNPAIRDSLNGLMGQRAGAGAGATAGGIPSFGNNGFNPFAALGQQLNNNDNNNNTNTTQPNTNTNPINNAQVPNFAALANAFGGFGNNNNNNNNNNNIPPEQRYEVQLGQMADMGFLDAQKNIRALQATGGNVHAAIEYLLSNL